MPLCTLRLLSLYPTTSNPIQSFLTTLQSTQLKPLVVSRVVRWIILPTSLSTDELLARNIHWDVLVILPEQNALPPVLQALIQHHWSVTAGIPSSLIKDFASKNRSLLHPDPLTVPQLTGSLNKPNTTDSAQDLELSRELGSWIQEFTKDGGAEGKGAISMLNLLSFKPNMKDSYLQYGQSFASNIGKKRGGNAKIVGTVVDVDGKGKADWDEIALAHYPSLLHFADMLSGQDYQEVNKKYRVPALKDTFILFTSEIGIEEMSQGAGDSWALGKL